MDYRVLHEAINESEYLIKSTEKFVANNRLTLNDDELGAIEKPCKYAYLGCSTKG